MIRMLLAMVAAGIELVGTPSKEQTPERRPKNNDEEALQRAQAKRDRRAARSRGAGNGRK